MSDAVEAQRPPITFWRRLKARLERAWRWLLAFLRAPATVTTLPAKPPSGSVAERRDLSTPMSVPAQGYVFGFYVHASFVWRAEGVERDVLTGSIQALMPFAVRALKQTAARHARDFPPHKAREFEGRLQATLAARGPWRFEWDGKPVTCRPHAWVELDERVKKAVAPYTEEMIKLDCEHEVQVKRSEHLDELSHRWREILEALLQSTYADGAAEMTDKDLAAVVERIVSRQRDDADRLHATLLDRLQSGDAFERAEVLDLLMQQLRSPATPGGAARNGHS